MNAAQTNPLDGLVRIISKLLLATALIVTLAVLCYLVALSPMLMTAIYEDDRDWSKLANIGETYGIASALLAVFALAVVMLSLIIQVKQLRYMRRNDYRKRVRETVVMALEEPGFAQCWGARFAPDHVNEGLFFYSSFVVLNWSYAWEDRLISEPKLRQLLRAFFSSEVPRMYWERNGDWHQPRRRWPRRRRFLDIVNEEYLRAIKAGPPARPHEPLPVRSRVLARNGGRRAGATGERVP